MEIARWVFSNMYQCCFCYIDRMSKIITNQNAITNFCIWLVSLHLNVSQLSMNDFKKHNGSFKCQQLEHNFIQMNDIRYYHPSVDKIDFISRLYTNSKKSYPLHLICLSHDKSFSHEILLFYYAGNYRCCLVHCIYCNQALQTNHLQLMHDNWERSMLTYYYNNVTLL